MIKGLLMLLLLFLGITFLGGVIGGGLLGLAGLHGLGFGLGLIVGGVVAVFLLKKFRDIMMGG